VLQAIGLVTAPAFVSRGVRPVVRVRPSKALLELMARGECLCALIDAADRPCLTCAAQEAVMVRTVEEAHVPPKPRLWADLSEGERFAVLVAVGLWLAVVAVVVLVVRGVL
jgi:hypothetical protein